MVLAIVVENDALPAVVGEPANYEQLRGACDSVF